MPRRRPGHVRAGLPRRRRAYETGIDGLSPQALSEIVRLERTRNYLQPGDVGRAVRRWEEFVRLPEQRQWHEFEWDDTHWYCCGDPLEGRVLLDGVLRAMSRRGARELGRVVGALDAFCALPALIAPRPPPRLQ
ncbi:hypothetical protein [Streptomyces sp. NPDC002537]